MKETSRFRFVFFSESSAVTRRQEFDEAMEQFKVRALGNLGTFTNKHFFGLS